MSGGSRRRLVKVYQPWPAPALAACYTDPSVLPEIERWVTQLREQGQVGPEVEFTIGRRYGVPVGVLRDRAGEHELLSANFLVLGRDGLQVLDERTFFERFHDPS